MTAVVSAPDPLPIARNPSRPHPRRAVALDRLVVGGLAALVAAIAGWLFIATPTRHAEDLVSGVASPIVDIVAACFLARAAIGLRSRRGQAGWWLLAAAMAVYAAGDALWAWIALVEGKDPFPSLADAGYVAFYPIAGAALLLFPAAALARREAIRVTIDSAIVILGGGMLVWHSLLRPALTSASPDPVQEMLALGYPVGDLVLLFAVATIAMRRPAGMDPRAVGALVAGLALMFVADVAYGELMLADAPNQGWVDVAYLASSVMLAAAGAIQARTGEVPDVGEPAGLSRWLLYLPYIALAAGFGVLLAASRDAGIGDLSDLIDGAAGLAVLVLVRQELINRENGALLVDRARQRVEARYRSLEGQGSDAYVLVDPNGVAAYASSSIERVLDVDTRSIIGASITRLAHADDAAALRSLIEDTAAGRPVAPLEWRLWTRAGTWRQVETVPANLLADAAIGKIVLSTRDVRERTALKQQAAQAALRDIATGLPNRLLFHDRVAQAVVAARSRGTAAAILQLDIDAFHRVNGSVGQAAGDQVLREVGGRLTAAVCGPATVARVGGDEFGILLDGLDEADAGEVAARVRSALAQPMVIGGACFELTASMGIAALSAADEQNEISLLRCADVALRVARERGNDHVVAFEPSMLRALEDRVHLESELRDALANDELLVQYQPIVDLATGELVAAEALVRWDHPTRGRLAPGSFVPLAEEIGLIGAIGSQVLRTACRDVAAWALAAHGRVPRVSVNLAGSQVEDPQLAWEVQSALASASAVPGWLTLEVTESMLVRDPAQALERLHALRALGAWISVDDFGTGYSSLSYLQQFPLNHIKIDRSFVSPLDDPDGGSGLAGAIVEIGRALGMSTVAEGIETERQRDRLLAMGCAYGQGFLFGAAMDHQEIVELVATDRRPRATLPG